ncbi:MAG TPA: N-formylglutamate amidohydrolase, partial [Candidatus Saccharimonadia bacterium]|nr:N-formylglutamate amidohydrolase [Candidatus Saccharimonadia bacterium]
YTEGEAPDASEVATRVDSYWRPYHDALITELDRIVREHGRAVLWEAHTIRGVVPLFFDGTLPDLNLGTSGGASCSAQLQQRLEHVLAAQRDYTFVANGRFKGGYITRHYAAPARGIDAVQLELAQRTYMDEATFAYDLDAAARLQPVLRRLLEVAIGPS